MRQEVLDISASEKARGTAFGRETIQGLAAYNFFLWLIDNPLPIVFGIGLRNDVF